MAAGAADTDAVNVAQLKAVDTKIGDLQYSSNNYITNDDSSTVAIGSLDTQLKTTDDKVGDNQYASTNYVAANDSSTVAIGKLDTQVKTNADTITTVSGDVAANKTAIQTNTNNITTLDGRVTTNTSNIATNTTNIATISGDMSAIKSGSITVAVPDGNYISGTKTLGQNLGSLDTQLKTTDDKVGDNQYVSTNYVAANDSSTVAIGKLDTQVKTNADTITTVSGDVAVNKTAIQTNTNNIATNTANIAAISSDMSAIKSGSITVAVPDGNYISGTKTLGQNLSSLDTQLKTTDDKVGDINYTSTNYVDNTMNVTQAISKLDSVINTGVSADVAEIKKTLGNKEEYTSKNIINENSSVIANISALDASQGNQQYEAVKEVAPVRNGDSTTIAVGKLNNSVGNVNNYVSTNLIEQGDSTVTAISKLDENIGDLKYNAEEKQTVGGSSFATKSKAKAYKGRVLDGDNVTVAIGKLNNSIGDVNGYTSTNIITQGASLTDNVSALDEQVMGNSSSIADLYWRQGELNTSIEKVGAGSAALAGLHPLEFNPDDKFSFAAAYGNYGSQHALAAGMFYRPSESVIYSLASTLSNDRNQFNLGVAFTFGGAKRMKKISALEYKTMGETIKELNGKLEVQSEQIEELMRQLEELKVKVK